MAFIKSVYIRGFKKYEKIEIHFNENMNIIVGENESGKSTILEAISLVMNQQYRSADKSILKDLFNVTMIKKFQENPSVETLPYINIEVCFSLDPKAKNTEYFHGENNHSKTALFGICFKCEFDKELGFGLDNEISEGKIPYEYYSLKWTSFSGMPYIIVKRPLGFISIDTSYNSSNDSFNYYNKTLFNNHYEEDVRLNVKNSFRDKLQNLFETIEIDDIDESRKFGINDKKIIFENVIGIYENSVLLENKGSGMESLIKTRIALDKEKSKLDVVLIEEPENHLSHTNMNKMIHEIVRTQDSAQIIITTHNNLIASKLDLNNVIWINANKPYSLRNIDANTAKFFTKAENNNFLQLLLSPKVILVEGATEALLLPAIYKKETGRNIEDDSVWIIPCNGISYKKYLKIAEFTNKKIVVLTDNDKVQSRIDTMKSFNEKNELQHIFMDESVKNWTLEVCLYNLNSSKLDEIIKVKKESEYFVKGIDVGNKVLGKMLNNKVESAYVILEEEIDIIVPAYIKEAIKWINE